MHKTAEVVREAEDHEYEWVEGYDGVEVAAVVETNNVAGEVAGAHDVAHMKDDVHAHEDAAAAEEVAHVGKDVGNEEVEAEAGVDVGNAVAAEAADVGCAVGVLPVVEAAAAAADVDAARTYGLDSVRSDVHMLEEAPVEEQM